VTAERVLAQFLHDVRTLADEGKLRCLTMGQLADELLANGTEPDDICTITSATAPRIIVITSEKRSLSWHVCFRLRDREPMRRRPRPVPGPRTVLDVVVSSF
jgi:hypothetical protein